MQDPRQSPPASPTVRAAGSGVRLQQQVDATREALREVRSTLRELLESSGFSPRFVAAALDVTHELLVNAHQHGAPPVELTVAVGAADMRVAVSDHSTDPARVLPYRAGVSERGLGVRLVRQLSRDWGQDLDDHGKVVWARII